MQQKKISFTILVLKNLENISLPAQKKNEKQGYKKSVS